jgi:hypothetical protein
MAAIMRTERRAQSSFVQEAEGLLNDIISKSEHFGADSFEVGYALMSIPSYATKHCPAEPATSSMDIALRAAGIFRRMELKP